MACQFCARLEDVMHGCDCERIRVDGFRDSSDKVCWVVDVVTSVADGHGNAKKLEEAIHDAVLQLHAPNPEPRND